MDRSIVGLDYRPALLSSSGIARAVRELARALAARGDVELHLFGHSLARAARSDPTPARAVLHRLPIAGRAMPLLARVGLDAARLCGGVPLFHWTDYVHPPVRSAAAVLTVHDLAFASDPTFHGAQSDELLTRTRTAARQAQSILTPSTATARDAARHLDVDASRITVIPWGVDHVPARLDGRPPRDDDYLVALGTIEPRKNHMTLLRALRDVTPRPHLVLIGRRGWECDAIAEAIDEAVQRGDATWYRELDDAAVFRFVKSARALVYPSHLEGFGFPPLEALALGTPVIAGDTPALRETLADAAWFCDPADPASITAALEAVAGDRTRRRAQCERGLKRAGELTWSRCAAAHAAAYRQALPASRGASF